MLEFAGRDQVDDLHQVDEGAAVTAVLARHHQPEQAGGAEIGALLVGEPALLVALGGADPEPVRSSAQLRRVRNLMPGTALTTSCVLIFFLFLEPGARV